MDDLKAFRVPGPDPLRRRAAAAPGHLRDLARAPRPCGFYVGLSSNGALIDEPTADRIARDRLRLCRHQPRRHRRGPRPLPPPVPGAYDASLARHAPAAGTAASRSACASPSPSAMSRACPRCSTSWRQERIDKFYLSHLVYAGRGNRYRDDDAYHRTTRAVMDLVFERCWRHVARRPRDGVRHRQQRRRRRLLPALGRAALPRARGPHPRQARSLGRQRQRGQRRQHRQSGQRPPRHLLVALRPRQRAASGPFGEIWQDISDPIMAGLKAKPRPHQGPLRRLPRVRDLRRQHARARDADRPATPGPRTPPATSPTRRSAWWTAVSRP